MCRHRRHVLLLLALRGLTVVAFMVRVPGPQGLPSRGMRLRICSTREQGGAGGTDDLEAVLGKGKGKHARQQRRKKGNKYEKFSKATRADGLDPLDLMLQEADRANNPQLAAEEEAEARRQEKRERGAVEYPSILEIDPYEPNTFGFIEAGVVMGAHGVDGMLKVRATSDVGEEMLRLTGTRYLKAPLRRYPRPVAVKEARHMIDEVFLVQLDTVTDREGAARLRDAKLYVREEDRPATEEDEFFVKDLAGMHVVLVGAEDTHIGSVVDVITAEEQGQGLGNDLLEVELLNEEDCLQEPTYMVLIPFVKAIVPTVNFNSRTIYIDPPSGLLDLAYKKTERVIVRGSLPKKSRYSDMKRTREQRRVTDETEGKQEENTES